MGKVHAALLKNERQRGSENNQFPKLTAILQQRRCLGTQNIFSELFFWGLCLGLALCNMIVLLLHLLF